jgi:hypothetical protein
MDRAVPDMRPKAYRWVAEMQQIAEFVGEAETGATIYEGAAVLFQRIASSS